MADETPTTPKVQTQIVVKPPSPPSQESDIRPFGSPRERDPHKTPFFKSRARRRRSDTWVISVFVILHVVAFAATMAVNDCGRNSHGECVLKSLGRLSFQPLSENPLLGPSASTWVPLLTSLIRFFKLVIKPVYRDVQLWFLTLCLPHDPLGNLSDFEWFFRALENLIPPFFL